MHKITYGVNTYYFALGLMAKGVGHGVGEYSGRGYRSQSMTTLLGGRPLSVSPVPPSEQNSTLPEKEPSGAGELKVKPQRKKLVL